jgi:hypothetical protein
MTAAKHDITLPTLPEAHGSSVLLPRASVVRHAPAANGAGLGGSLGMVRAPRRTCGALRGLIVSMSDDFDAPLDDFSEYAP